MGGIVHILLMACVPLCVWLTYGGWVWLRARRTTRAAAARARDELLPDPSERDVEAVRGTLRVDGDPLESEHHTGRVAATTAWMTTKRGVWDEHIHEGQSERAGSVFLIDGDREVRLDGRIVVVVGSDVRWTSERIYTGGGHGSPARAAVHDGDEVVAVGRLTREVPAKPQKKAGYRKSSKQPVLSDLGMAAADAPRVRMQLSLLKQHPMAHILALLACYFPVWALWDYSKSDCSTVCDDYGWCAVTPQHRVQPFAEALLQLLKGDHFVCAPGDAADCRASRACVEDGQCTPRGESCVAVDREDCLHNDGCLRWASCTPNPDGSCVLGSEDDCLHTTACLEEGLCSGVGGRCIARREADCAASSGCALEGECGVLRDGTCGPTRDEHCVGTADCDLYGRCSAVDGACGVGDADCAARLDCLDKGECTASGGACVAKTATCEESFECGEKRQCVARDERCDVDAPTCRESAACRVHGRCEGPYSCHASSDEDCRASERCETHGECRRVGELCVKSCRASAACRMFGRCTEVDDQCVAARDSDCTRARVCKEDGFCKSDGERCVLGDDCTKTPECRHRGRCTSSSGCHLVSDEDCARTAACEHEGKCSFEAYQCVAQGDDCRRTRACREIGACVGVERVCQPGSDADCEQSAVCERNGWCRVVRVDGSFGRPTTACGKAPPKG